LFAGGAEEEVCSGITGETAEEGGCCIAAEEIWLLTIEKKRLLAEGAERKMIAAVIGHTGMPMDERWLLASDEKDWKIGERAEKEDASDSMGREDDSRGEQLQSAEERCC
jgi:hypothetical protein